MAVHPSRPTASRRLRSTFRILSLLSAFGGVALSTASILVTSCAGDDPGPDSQFGPDGASGATSTSTSTTGGLVPAGDASPPPLPPDASPTKCAEVQAEPVPGKRPVDIIFVIDNSTSMSEEISEVEAQINKNFATIIGGSNADYHVVMLSAHGSHENDSGVGDAGVRGICVETPLSATNCAPIPPEPAENDNFLHHDIVISSNNSLCRILQTFNGPDDKGRHPQGWAPFLRPSAFKIFAVITDDHVNTSCSGFSFDDKSLDPISGANTASTFESALFALSPLHFGSAQHHNFVWHSIIGLAPFDTLDLTKPHPSSAPIVTTVCSPGAESPATGYQGLSKDTGGLRYPTCGLDFTTIFRAMAQDVLDKTALACDYAMPPNPDSGLVDPASTVVNYQSGTTSSAFQQVANPAACGPYKFYVEESRIKLCNDACALVRNDPDAKVTISFGCLPRPSSSSGNPQ